MGEHSDIVSPFCQGCTLKCTNEGRGCVAWQKWYIDWWNRNITSRNSENSSECKEKSDG